MKSVKQQPSLPVTRKQHPLLPVTAWKFFFIFIITLGIVLRLVNLDQKVYSADEVRSILRLSGHTSQKFIEQVYTGNTVTVAEILSYQQPSSQKNLTDVIKALTGNPEHPPLYQLLTRFWLQLFNTPVAARIFSALLSILAFPCLYWLCWELSACTK